MEKKLKVFYENPFNQITPESNVFWCLRHEKLPNAVLIGRFTHPLTIANFFKLKVAESHSEQMSIAGKFLKKKGYSAKSGEVDHLSKRVIFEMEPEELDLKMIATALKQVFPNENYSIKERLYSKLETKDHGTVDEILLRK